MDLANLAKNFFTAIVVLVVISAIVMILAPFVGWRADVVLSGSMEPAIMTGGMAIVGPVTAGNIHVGDIIAFNDGSRSVCHRVVAIQDGQPLKFVTRGDANGTPDPDPVTPERVIGRVVFSIPLIGYLIYFMKTPVGLFLFILLPLLILIGMELKKLIFDKKEDDSPRNPE